MAILNATAHPRILAPQTPHIRAQKRAGGESCPRGGEHERRGRPRGAASRARRRQGHQLPDVAVSPLHGALGPILGRVWWSPPAGGPAIKSKDGALVPPRFAWLPDITAFPNWSLLSHYFNVGVALNFLATPVSYYLVETLNSSSAIVNTYSAATYLPWCLKIFFGLQSDLVPLFGMHRRSYYAIGWIVFVVSIVWLMLMGTPSAVAVILLSFVQTMGALLSDTWSPTRSCSSARSSRARPTRGAAHARLPRAAGRLDARQPDGRAAVQRQAHGRRLGLGAHDRAVLRAAGARRRALAALAAALHVRAQDAPSRRRRRCASSGARCGISSRWTACGSR